MTVIPYLFIIPYPRAPHKAIPFGRVKFFSRARRYSLCLTGSQALIALKKARKRAEYDFCGDFESHSPSLRVW